MDGKARICFEIEAAQMQMRASLIDACPHELSFRLHD
jgi:hypothetical protein